MNPAGLSSSDKSLLRDCYIEKRRELARNVERKTALDMEIQTRLIISPEYRAAEKVLVYMARPFEIATSMIIHAALANNKKVGLPVCMDDRKMVFRRIRSIADLGVGRFGILEPSAECEELAPDDRSLCVCPCLCCDMDGFRLGFGGGYYDRFLLGFSGVKAALCYGDCVLPSMQRDDYDIPMDVIFTDSFTRYIR